MPAPKRPNTAAATATVRRRGQETMAAKLRAAGWKVEPPEHGDSLYQVAVDWLLNKQYPDEQARFWAIAEGAVVEDEADKLSDAEIQERRETNRPAG